MLRQLLSLLLLGFVLLLISCEKETIALPDDSELEGESQQPQAFELDPSLFSQAGTLTKSCSDANQYFQGGYTGVGYNFTTYNLNLSCVATGASIRIDVEALDVPNRFVVKHNGNIIATTQWIGSSGCPGPWGSSISTLERSTLRFNKPSSGTVQFIIETVTHPSQGNDNGPNCEPLNDAWRARLGCSCTTTSPPTTPSGSCTNLTKNYQGSYFPNGQEFYTYDKPLNFTGMGGCTITMKFDPLEVPNDFFLQSSPGNTVYGTGWLGYANYNGPWGYSLNKLQPIYKTYTIPNGARIFNLRVNTLTPPVPDTREDVWRMDITNCNCPN